MPVDPPTFQELYDAGQNEIIARDATLTDFNDGSNLDAINGSAAVLADETNLFSLQLFKAHFIDTASGDDLDALALDRVGLTRFGATFAIGQVFWRNFAGSYAIPSGTVLEGALPSGDLFQVETTEDAVSDSGLPIPVQALVTGRASNVAAGTLTTPVAFATDPTATVEQPSRLAGGADAETDEQFRARIRKFYQTLSKATIAAITAAAESVNGVFYAIVKEIFGATNSEVRVFIADIDGAGNPALVAAVDPVVQATKAGGILAVTVEAVREDILVTLEVDVPSGIDLTAAEAQIRAATLDYINNEPISESIYASQIAQDVHNALPEAISVVTKTGGLVFVSIAPSAEENTLRLTDANLTVVLNEVTS